MTKPRIVVAGFVWLGLLGFAGFNAHRASLQRAQGAELQSRQAELEREAASLRRAQATTAAELAQAEQQLAALPAPRMEASDLKAEHRTEIDRWLGRVRRLRQHFADKPDQRIPEMQFLKDEDWLRVAKASPLEDEDDVRVAAAAVRTKALRYFIDRISVALRAYTAANPGAERPASAQVFVAYFDPPIDPTLLERYHIVDRPSNVRGEPNATPWAVANRAPVDADYDTRFQVMGNGGASSSGLDAWMPELSARYRRAAGNFRKANPGGNAKGIDDVLPYFDPPLERDLADRLRRSERKQER